MSVLVVATPGLAFDAYQPLIRALRDDGQEVAVIEPGCVGGFDALAARVRDAVDRQPEPPIVVAHGLGATLALAAGGAVDRYVLLAPVLGVPRSAAIDRVFERPAGGRVDLRDAIPWEGHADLREVLLGASVPELGCFPPQLAADLAAFRAAGRIPLALDQVGAPVWMAVGLLDEIAPVEVAVPASRALPHRTVARPGITGFDPRDYGHLDLLVDPVAVRAAVRAVEGR